MAFKILTIEEIAASTCTEVDALPASLLEMYEQAAITSIEKELGYPLCATLQEYVFDNKCQECFFLPAYNPRFTNYGEQTYIKIDGVMQNLTDYYLNGSVLERCSCSCCSSCSCDCSKVEIMVQVGFQEIPACLKLLLLEKVNNLWAAKCSTPGGGDCSGGGPLKSISVKLGPKTTTKTWDTSSNTSATSAVDQMFEDCLCEYRMCPIVNV